MLGSGRTQGEEQGRKFVKLEPRSGKQYRFQFPSHELALQVRESVYLKVIEFDENGDEQFQEEEIKHFLEQVLNENGPEVYYFVKNIFRYDYNNDGKIEYDELVNFCMEQHFGEIAIQRLHRKKLYHRGSQRMMNLPEFAQTIKYALSFVEFAPQEDDIRMVFQVVDMDRDGYISYEDYFRFLKEYFGSKSQAAKMVNKLTVIELSHSRERKEVSITEKYSKREASNEKSPKITHQQNRHSIIIPDKPIIEPKPVPMVQPKPEPIVQPIPEPVVQPIVQPKPELLDQPKPHHIIQPRPQPQTPINSQQEESSQNNSDKKFRPQITLTKEQQGIASKIVRLVLSQLRVVLTLFDSDQKCRLHAEEIFTFMRKTFGYAEFMQSQVYKRGFLSRDNIYSYEDASRIIISEQIHRKYVPFEGQEGRPISQNDFVEFCLRVCEVVKNTPLVRKYESLFFLRTERGPMSCGQGEQLLLYIFNTCWGV